MLGGLSVVPAVGAATPAGGGAPNSIVPPLSSLAWLWYRGAPNVRLLALDSTGTPYANARSLVWINQEGTAIPDAPLQVPVTTPSNGGTQYQIHVDEVQIPSGTTGALALEVYDSTGVLAGRVTSQSFTPSTTATGIKTSTITLAASTEYLVRVNCNPAGGGQSSFICGAIRLVPMAPASAAWGNPYSTPAGPGFVFYELGAGRWSDSGEPYGRDNPRWFRRSELAHVDFQTNASSVTVVAYDNIGNSTGSPRDNLSLLVDGSPLDPPLAPTIAVTSYLTATMPTPTVAGQMRAVSLIDGPQGATPFPTPTLENGGTFATALIVPAGAAIAFNFSALRTVVNYGDSKLAAFYSTVPGRDSYVAMMRARGFRVVQEAHGGGSLAADVGTVASPTAPLLLRFARQLLRTSPAQINIGIGRNDFVGNTFGSTAAFIAQLQNLIRALHTLSPSTVIGILTWTSETTESNQDVSWNAARASMVALAQTAEFSSYVVIYDLARLWTPTEAPTYTADGVHPNDAGQSMIAQVLSGGPWPWHPSRCVPSLIAYYDPTVLATYVPGTAAVTSSGTSPPTLTITGTPATGVRNLRLECLVGGARGTATFRWTTDSDGGLGRHWDSAAGGVSTGLIPTAAAVVLGSTGLTANFANTSFANDNVWLVVMPCAGLTDLSGAGNNMVQATGAFQPKLVGNADAAYPTVGPAVAIPGMLFTPNSLLHLTGVSIVKPYSIYCVARAVDGTSRALFGSGSTGASSNTAPVVYLSSTSVIANDGTTQITNTNGNPTATTRYALVVNSASSNLRVEGVDQAGTMAVTITDLAWGYDYKNSLAMSGYEMVLMIFSGALAAADLLALDAWAASIWKPGGPTGSGYAAAAVTSLGVTAPILNSGSASAPVVAIQASSGSQAGSMSAAQAAQLAALPATFAAGFFFLDLTLSGGTVTAASGKDLTNAKVVAIYLVTPTTATGEPVVTFVAGANGNVTLTSYTAGAVQVSLDASKYRVVFAGAV